MASPSFSSTLTLYRYILHVLSFISVIYPKNDVKLRPLNGLIFLIQHFTPHFRHLLSNELESGKVLLVMI